MKLMKPINRANKRRAKKGKEAMKFIKPINRANKRRQKKVKKQ